MAYAPWEINPQMPPIEVKTGMTGIDFDRGVIIRTHILSGMDVCMYRDEPGVFLNAFGKPVSDAIARDAFGQARFDELVRRRQFRAKLKEAERAIEAEMATAAKAEKRVVRKADGLCLVDVGNDRYIIEDADGNRLSPQPLPKDTANKVFEKLADDAVEQMPPAPPWIAKDQSAAPPSEQVVSVKAGQEPPVYTATDVGNQAGNND